MKTTGRERTVVFAVLAVSAFAAAWNFTFLSPVLKEVAGDAGVSVTAAGQLVSVAAVVAAVSLVALGPLADRYGRRPSLLAGLIAMAVAAFGSAATSEYWLLFALRVLSGLGDALVLPSAYAAVADYYEGKSREMALNALLVPLGAAVVTGLPVVVIVSELADWHAAFLVFGLFNAVAAAGVYLAIRRPIKDPAAHGSLRDHYRESYAEVLRHPAVVPILVAAVLGAATWNGMVTYAGAFFEDELSASGAVLSLLFALLGGSYVAGGGIGIMLAGRFRSRYIAIRSSIAATLLPVAIVSTPAAPVVAVFLASLFAGSRAPGVAALNNMILDIAPHSQATAISVHGVVFMGGAIIGAGIGGAAIALEGYTGMGAVFSGMALIATVALLTPAALVEAARPAARAP